MGFIATCEFLITTSPGPARALVAESTVRGVRGVLSQAAKLWEIVMLIVGIGMKIAMSVWRYSVWIERSMNV